MRTIKVASEGGSLMDKLEEMYMDLATKMARMEGSIDSINQKFTELKNDIKDIQRKSLETHERIEKFKALTDFFWSRIVPNLTWILVVAGAVIEFKQHWAH